MLQEIIRITRARFVVGAVLGFGFLGAASGVAAPSGERATKAPPQFNLTCLAPILNTVDPDAPADLSQAWLFGPWHQPAAREDLGTVSFPVSTASRELQSAFDQGMAALHLFWYGEAQRCFRAASAMDPGHPMPYWGLALANERSPQRAAFFAAEAERRSHNRADLSEREREWLKAVVAFYRGGSASDRKEETLPTAEQWSVRRRTLVRELERMAFTHPDDVEIAAALLRRVVTDHHRAGDPIASHYANNLLADRLAKLAPDHPSRHYRLFLWLGPDAGLALPQVPGAAAVAPGAPHSWRYAAETFRSAGRMAEAVEFGSNALRAGHREMACRGEPMPDCIEDLVSHYEACIADLAGAGRYIEARDTARQLVALPRTFYREKRHTRSQRLAGSFFRGRRLLGQLHVSLELWRELLEECESGALAPVPDDPFTAIESSFWKGIAHCNLGGTARASGIVKDMSAGLRAAKSEGATVDEEEFMVHLARTLRTHVEYSSGKRARLPDKEIDVTWLPAVHLARLYLAAGLREDGLRIIEAENAGRPGQFLTTATYCDLQHRSGNSREAFYAFDQSLRSNASLAHSSLPVLRRLDEVAAAMRVGRGWRLPAPKTERFAQLPEPATIGPAAWTPSAAPPFSQPDQSAAEITLEQFSGKPVVFNFFLGAGCGFCRQQLDLFTPVLPEFEKAGISFVGVTTDSLEVLQGVIKAYETNDPEASPFYAFPVLSDAQGLMFNAYGAFEEFEKRPIHGTVFVDGSGRVLWSDLGHEPFNHPIQLLREAERLLRLHGNEESPAQTSKPNQP